MSNECHTRGYCLTSGSYLAFRAMRDHMPHTPALKDIGMTITYAERGRIGGHATQANRTPEQRREMGLSSYLTAAVTTVVNRAPELSPEQRARLRALFAPAVEGGDQR